MKKYAIIVAGGSGTRMKSEVPKQFLVHCGEPIIIKTIRKFLDVEEAIKIIVVLPHAHLEHWNALQEQFPFISKITTATGGATRTDSVKSGLEKIETDGLVAIHDAVRPFVETNTILASFKSAEKFGSGVAAVELKDSIREVMGDESKARDRSNFVLVQTPQTFRVKELNHAYSLLRSDTSFSDDATVFESAGYRVILVDGSYSNIKITTPEDLK